MIKNEEHAFKTFSKLIGKNNFPKVVLLYGREQFLVDWAYSEIIRSYINSQTKTMDLSVFDDEKLDVDNLTVALETFPIASKKKVVAVCGFTALKTEAGKTLKVDDEQKMLKLFENISDESILIITAVEVDKRKKLFKAIEKNGTALNFDSLSEKDLNSFIVKHFSNYGKDIEMAAIAQLIKNSGYFNKETDYTLYNLENDIRKICAYSESNTVIASDVLVFVSENLESSVFSMLDALTAGNVEHALLILDTIMKNGVNEYQIIALLASQFELMLKISEMKDEGFNVYAISSGLKVHEYRVRKASEFVHNCKKKDIIKALENIYSMDRKIKEGTMQAGLLLELFFSITGSFIMNKGEM
ncbi:MAG: DNA polymerase III subunit delta [Eubacteriales bacterium]